MSRSANPPVYSQVAFDIASKIASGEIREGERFTDGRPKVSDEKIEILKTLTQEEI